MCLKPVLPDYEDYLKDESRMNGDADCIAFPKTEQDLDHILGKIIDDRSSVTVQGGRTGIAGGAVPDGGCIINLSKMNHITGLTQHPEGNGYSIHIQPGVVLDVLRHALQSREFDTTGWSKSSLQALASFKADRRFFFTPDPTETTATIGGMIACNASGALSFKYGATRSHILSLRVMLTSGHILSLTRGVQKTSGRMFETDLNGPVFAGSVPCYTIPDVKSAAGYFAKDNMDLLDLFIGSEGTLGIITEAELALTPYPEYVWGVTAFFPAEEGAIRFVQEVRDDADSQSDILTPAAIEFFDANALGMLHSHLQEHPGFADLPDIPKPGQTAIYLEYHGDSEEAMEAAIEAMSIKMDECGGDEQTAWMAMDETEMERLHNFRHAIPEIVNLTIDERRKKDPSLTKLGTDMSVPSSELAAIMKLYRTSLEKAGLQFVIFGHIGNNHVHVNILPETTEDYKKGKALYLTWADQVIKMCGSISAEHGIGKLKTAFLEKMYGPQGIQEMKEVKKVFDPDGVLSPGNLFESV